MAGVTAASAPPGSTRVRMRGVAACLQVTPHTLPSLLAVLGLLVHWDWHTRSMPSVVRCPLRVIQPPQPCMSPLVVCKLPWLHRVRYVGL